MTKPLEVKVVSVGNEFALHVIGTGDPGHRVRVYRNWWWFFPLHIQSVETGFTTWPKSALAELFASERPAVFHLVRG